MKKEEIPALSEDIVGGQYALPSITERHWIAIIFFDSFEWQKRKERKERKESDTIGRKYCTSSFT